MDVTPDRSDLPRLKVMPTFQGSSPDGGGHSYGSASKERIFRATQRKAAEL